MGSVAQRNVKTINKTLDALNLEMIVRIKSFVYIERMMTFLDVKDFTPSLLTAFSVGAALIVCKMSYDKTPITPKIISNAFGIHLDLVLAAESFAFDNLLKTSLTVTDEEMNCMRQKLSTCLSYSCWHFHQLHIPHSNVASPSNLVQSL